MSEAGVPGVVAGEGGLVGGVQPRNADGTPLSKTQLKKLSKGQLKLGPDGVVLGADGEVPEVKGPSEKEKRAAEFAAAAAKSSEKKKTAVEAVAYENTTPPGARKATDGEMSAAYHPQAVEAAWDSWWSAQGYFSADTAVAAAAGEGGRFVMVIPPPNVTGSLHLGHALTSSIEDSLARWHRMCGKPVLWLPGTDHAGIATQTVVEKRLKKERGLTRHDLGREAFMQEVWKWKETFGNKITSQLRHMGVSTDWSRERFTMDAGLSASVKEAFVRLHEDGLIYRENRLVNWCCTLRSAISDIEVEYVELEKRTRLAVPGHDPLKRYEFGAITSFAYRVVGGGEGEEIVVATTRPETMLGDTAVAVHPEDPRYTHLHGKHVLHPFDGRHIPIIQDAELVDMSFGTGAVKITPAHDPNDFVCGKRHGLDFITVFTEEGAIIPTAPAPFAGLMRFDAREAITKALEAQGLLRGKADNKMRLGLCSRTNDVIEPLMKPQWYVKCDTMAAKAVEAVRSGELRIEPKDHEKTWYHWMENIKDWCVSRQLWWGHRIPAYRVTLAGKPPLPESGNSWVVARSEEEAVAIAAARFSVPPAEVSLKQDEDVLDTWFSSGLFPFSTFGWPNTEHPDYKAFYPNTILETGWDILFFWVARMVMMGQQLTGQLPFRTVYLHAMVRDKYGRKMSKSLGNVVDPLEVIYGCTLDTLHAKVTEGNLPAKEVEAAIKAQKVDFPDGIPECGADALRFGLLAYTVQGRDVNLDINRVVGYRQFCNKLWNATRFALAHLTPEKYTPTPILDTLDEVATSPHLAVRDRWILSRLNHATVTANNAMRDYAFGVACTAIYDFFLYELCDYYLELLKPLMAVPTPGSAAAAATPATPEALAAATAAASDAGGDIARAQRLGRATLHLCLERGFQLLHPMMPFVTEELWQRLPGRGLPQRATPGAAADPVSIMISAYPTSDARLEAEGVEANFAVFQALVKGGRSLRADADIPPSRAAVFYVAVGDAATAALAQAQKQDLVTLLKASELTFVTSPSAVPEGSSAYVVSDAASIHLQLKGLVDPVAEVAKLEKKSAKVTSELEGIKKRQSVATYKDKVPKEVQESDAASVIALEKQGAVILSLIAQYKSW